MKITFSFEFKTTDKIWMYDTVTKSWTQGPSLNEKRKWHSCLVDQKTSTIHVMGGRGKHGNRLSSTETLKYVNKRWEISSASNLPGPLTHSAATASRTNDIVGYLVGGDGNEIRSDIWALRRRDMKWVETHKRLQIPRTRHTLVNVRLSDIPGC